MVADELDMHPTRLAETLQERFRDVETRFAHAWWSSQVDAGPENEARRAEVELELRRIKGDPESFEAVTEALEQEFHDELLERQLTVLRLSVTGNQMSEDQRRELVELSSSVESEFASYRPVIDGKRLNNNDIEEILKTSNDVELRQRAWEGSKEIGDLVGTKLRELARVRNEIAHGLGYPDYYAMALDLQELSEPWLFELMDELEEVTREPFFAWKAVLDDNLRQRFGTEELYPWHYADPFFQDLPPDGRLSLDPQLRTGSPEELARATFGSWGIDLGGVLEASDLYPRENKSQHAFCIDMDRSGDDVRILANVVPGERWTEVVMHESGHAAYDISIDPSLPWLLRRASHIFTTEAIALLSGRLVREPRWLTEIAGVSSSDAASLEHDLRAARSAQANLFARWGLVMVHFERDFYADPEADLAARWWELVERFQGVQRPPDRDGADWASKIHLATAPVYYHNYLLGELLASQLQATCRREFGGIVGVPEAGALLTEKLFRPGASLRWDALVEGATGKPLSARDHADEMSAS